MKRALTCLLLFACLAACDRAGPTTPGVTSPVTARPTNSPPRPTFTRPVPTRPGQDMQAGRGLPSDTPTPETAHLGPTPDPLACLPRQSEPEIAQVKWAAAGDIIVVDLNGRQRSVRYLGVTAPPYRPNIRFTGPPAYLKNQALVQGQIVELYRDGPNTDDQGQLLRYVVTHGLFINLELARLGLVQVDPPSAGEPACAPILRQAEQTAQAAQVGLWGQSVFAAAASATHAATHTPANTPARTAVAALPTAAAPSATLQVSIAAPSSTPPAVPPSATPVTPTSGPTDTPIPGQPPSATPQPTATSIPVVIINTPRPSNTPAAPTATTTYLDVIITDVNFEGDPTKNEADEYVEISNDGTTPVNLLGWKLVSENTQVTFTFPSFIIQPDVVCYIYTNMVDTDSCVNSSFAHSGGLWSSDEGDCAQLYDSSGHIQDEYCY